MDFEREIPRIASKIDAYRQAGKRMFATSSFQPQSIPLLHIISRIDRNIPVYFLNTGYLFPETLAFKNLISKEFGLQIFGLEAAIPKVHQLDNDGHLLYTSDPDYCCYLNKVQPLEPILMTHDVWINGIRADQNLNRRNMKEEQAGAHGILRYHPILKWTAEDVAQYRQKHNLPSHPLEKSGYASIGCEPCTRKIDDQGNERNARWFGLNKTECGLHTNLADDNAGLPGIKPIKLEK